MQRDPMKLVNKVKSDLSAYRKQFESCRQREEEAYHGDIWKDVSKTNPYENEIFQIIEGEVPVLSDSIPAVAVMANNPELDDRAKVLSRSVEWVLKDQDFELDYPSVIRDSLISGDGWVHTYYDANAENGNGKIINEVIGWRQVYLSGLTRKIDDCEKARIELDRSKSWLKLNYQKFADKIDKLTSETNCSSYMDKEGLEDRDTGGKGSGKRKAPKKYRDDDTLILVKTYIKDYSVVSIPKEETEEDLIIESEALEAEEMPDINKWEDHKAHIEAHMAALAGLYEMLGLSPEAGFDEASATADALLQENPEAEFEAVLRKIKFLEMHIEEHKVLLEENPKSGRLKYKNGWRVIESINQLVLKDGEMDEEHGQIPVTPFYCYLAGSIYGYSEIRNILDSQKMSAELSSEEFLGLKRVANPAVIVDKETGLKAEDITNEPGAIYIVDGGGGIRHLDPGSVSPQSGSFRRERSEAMQRISGINEVTQGQVLNPNASGVAVSKQQNQAIGRIRLKDRQNQYYSIRRMGRIIASLIMQYWTSEKMVAFENGEEVIFNPLTMAELEYKVEIAPGSMTGVDKDSFNAQMFNLLNAGHITLDQYLKVADIPKAAKLASLVEEANNTQAQLEELQNENIMIKGQFAPETLTPEEAEIFEQLSQQTGTQ